MRADLIDLDELARIYVVAAKKRRNATQTKNPHLLRATLGLILAIFILLIVMARSTELILPVVIVALLFAFVWWFNRGAARRLATQLRSAPAAGEPYTFVADAAGMHSRGATGRDDLAWSRCTDVLVVDDSLVLVLGLASRIIPDRARVPSPLVDGIDEVVAQIRAWMAAATPSSAVVDSPWSRWTDGGPPST